jgi:two-component system OmpR family response regulator
VYRNGTDIQPRLSTGLLQGKDEAVPEGTTRGRVLLVGTGNDALDDLEVALRKRRLEVAGPFRPDDLPGDATGMPCAIVDLSTGDGMLRNALAMLCRAAAPRVVVITAATDVASRLAALQLGADDHVVAPYAVAEAVARVEVQIARAAQKRRRGLQSGGVTIDIEARRALYHGQDLPLTPREFDILAELMAAEGRAVSKKELLESVWRDAERHVNVVEAHVSALRRKVEAHGAQLIYTVHRQGYAFRPPRTPSPTTREALVAERTRLLEERDEARRRRDEVVATLRRQRVGRPPT